MLRAYDFLVGGIIQNGNLISAERISWLIMLFDVHVCLRFGNLGDFKGLWYVKQMLRKTLFVKGVIQIFN